ncbi:hypothetical protein [Burkholderia multivorans]|uniref:hypothetical protein n=1 Tax=Burkholderia multivorans TaxID=87883 RepID=UPI0011B1E631|nr:hypothetical protein [Burkholderia multivorans]MBU9526203.1 hypothetical protein [Burkholderia multivorans]MBU9536696.1 hypothetical protein [Burkholderia multivorans]MBU9635655.1 hypothetical protein [Burkholderia multivorans]HEF4768960.1 hypothetical protein [Burkholderia multivorans]
MDEQNKKLRVLGKTPTIDSTMVRKHGRLTNFSCGTGIYRAARGKWTAGRSSCRMHLARKIYFFPALCRPYTSFHQRHDVPYMEHMKRPSGWGIA